MCMNSQLVDGGRWYASKSFFDPVSGDQLIYGWVAEEDLQASANARGWAGMHSLPRRMWPSSTGNRMCFAVPTFMESLRTQLVELRDLAVSSEEAEQHIVWSEPVQNVYGNQQEVQVSFLLPVTEALTPKNSYQFDVTPSANLTLHRFGLQVLSSADMTLFTTVGFAVVYPAGADAAMQGVDLPGMDYFTASQASDPQACQRACIEQNGVCRSWTFVISATPAFCTLKNGVPLPDLHPTANVVSGILPVATDDPLSLGHCREQPEPSAGPTGVYDPQHAWLYVSRANSSTAPDASTAESAMPFLLDPSTDLEFSDDSTNTPYWRMTLQAFMDHSVVESFEVTGRAAIVARVYPDQKADAKFTRVFLPPNQPAQLDWLTAWNMTSIFQQSSTKSLSLDEVPGLALA